MVAFVEEQALRAAVEVVGAVLHGQGVQRLPACFAIDGYRYYCVVELSVVLG